MGICRQRPYRRRADRVCRRRIVGGASRPRRACRGCFLAGAALTKFYPAVLLPALYRRWGWKMPAAFAGGDRHRLSAVHRGRLAGARLSAGLCRRRGVRRRRRRLLPAERAAPACRRCRLSGARLHDRRRRDPGGARRRDSVRRAMTARSPFAAAGAAGDGIHGPRLAALPLVLRLADRLCLLRPARSRCCGSRMRVCCFTWCRSGRTSCENDHRLAGRIDHLRAVCGAGAGRSLVLSPPRQPGAAEACRSARARQRRSDPQPLFRPYRGRARPVAEVEPVCLYLETTNRCNLLCTTCPRTFEALEPPADMSWELFTRIVDQFPRIARVVLHGVGEPMMVPALPRMIRYLKDRGTYVLFNTNGTLLTRRKGRELIDSGLDELRVSLDAAEPKAFKLVRGRDMFARIVRNVRGFRAMQRELGVERPRVSLWLTGLKETRRPAARFRAAGARHRRRRGLSAAPRLFPRGARAGAPGIGPVRRRRRRGGPARARGRGARPRARDQLQRLGRDRARQPASTPQDEAQPWSLCRRPWTLMYFTAHGRAIPCCIAPFSMRGYDSFTLGDATQQSLREIWNGPRYQAFRSALVERPAAAAPAPVAGCAGACER